MKRRMFVAATGAAAGAAFGAERAAPSSARAAEPAAYMGPWAGRPAANAAAIGTEIAITDLPAGRVSRWFSDGSTWRSTSGSVLLYAQGKGYSAPLGSVTWGRAAVTMAIPGGSILIPAGLVEPGLTELRVSVLWATGANTGGIAAQMTIGTTNSWSDTQCNGAFLGPNNEWDQVASFTFPTATTMSQASSLTPLNGTPVGAIGNEFFGNIDAAADMYINFGTTLGGAPGNVLKIVRAKVELFL
jgi:hypothetical protein